MNADAELDLELVAQGIGNDYPRDCELADEALGRLRVRVDQYERALRAAEGVLFALPKSAQSERRTEVLAQVRQALR